ncbi:MAG: ABC transporter ATP-binding protein [Paraclostridium sp.]
MRDTLKKLKWIFSQSKPGLFLLIVSVIMGSIMSAISVYNAMISKSLIDAATTGKVDLVIKWLTVMGCIILFNIFFGTLRSLISTYCSTKISNELQKKFFAHVAYSEWMEHNKHHSMGILTRITSDTATINGFICGTIPSMITSTVMLGISFITLLSIAPFLAVFTVVIFPVLFLMNKLFGKRLKKFYKDIQDKSIEYSSFIQESIQNLMIVKTFCREEDAVDTMARIQKERFSLVLKQTLFSSCTGIAFSLGSSGAYFLVFGWGAMSLVNGVITFGTMTALLQLFNKIQGPLSSLIGCYSPIISTIAAAERLMEMESMALEKGNPHLDILCADKPYIEFDNVSFGYKDGVNVLNNISFDINPGETIALVGPSGQGKTTIIRLLLSLIHANEGNLYISDNTLDGSKSEVCKDHRNLISYIPQGNTLFSGSISENVCYGNTKASSEDILSACEAACALDFIDELDDGFDTKLGEKGHGISEGQAQRIAIARAFLRTKPILILDEATSALDAQTEINVLRAIKNLGHKPTCIIITHRPGALAICDRVLRLEKGNLFEEGSDFMFETATDLA